MRLDIGLKRVYDPPEPKDGLRVLVDRLWPRALSKEGARIDEWVRELAPSHALRQWFGHDPNRWEEFRRRYRDELLSPERRQKLSSLLETAFRQKTTFLFGAKDRDHNNAVVLREVLMAIAREERPQAPSRPKEKTPQR